MWRISGIVAVLLTLGLSAAGLVSPQKIAAVSSSRAVSDSPAGLRAQAAPVDLLATLVNPSSDGFRDDIDAGRSTEPSRLAEPGTPGIRDTPAADEVVEDKPMAFPPCDKAKGYRPFAHRAVRNYRRPGLRRREFQAA